MNNNSFFSNLLIRYIQNKSTKTEQTLLDDFFNSLSADLDWDEKKLGDKEYFKARLKNSINQNTQRRKLVPNLFIYTSIAASILLLIGSFFHINSAEKTNQFFTKNDIDSLFLKDGSKIILGPNSLVEYPDSFEDKSRIVYLRKGNAYFKIARDTMRPFMVKHDKLLTRVLGTSFNINTNDKKISVYVITGKVAVKTNDNKTKSLLPSDIATYEFSSGELKKENEPNFIPWYSKKIKLKEITLEELSNIIENRFDYKVIFKSESVKNKILTLSVDSNTTIQSLVKQLIYITNLEIKIKDHEIEINESK